MAPFLKDPYETRTVDASRANKRRISATMKQSSLCFEKTVGLSIWSLAVILCCCGIACAQTDKSKSRFDQLRTAGTAISACQRIASVMELPTAGSAAFLFACVRRSGVTLGSVHVEGDRLSSDVRNLTGAARVVANDLTLWPTIIRTDNIANLAIRLGETDVLTQESKYATRAALGKCSDARCIAAVFEQGYRDRMDFIRAHAAPFPQLAINSMMPCANPSASRRLVISLAPSDAFISGTVSGIDCSMNEPVAVKGEMVQNVATLSYAALDGTTRNAVVVVSGDNLYWQALEVTSGLQEGSVDGLIVRLPQRADINATDDGARCTEGPPQPADFGLRPTRTVECPYGFDELVGRITRLSINASLPDSVETVERAFGLPEMTTSNDDPQSASYMMILSGNGGWRFLDRKSVV